MIQEETFTAIVITMGIRKVDWLSGTKKVVDIIGDLHEISRVMRYEKLTIVVSHTPE